MSQTATTVTTSRKHSVKQKLSSLVRRGSSLRLLDGARRDKKAASAKVQYFTPLNVDLEKLQPIRLGWEEPEPTEQNDAKQKEEEEENKKKEEQEVPLNSTPIADMFAARRSTLDLSTLSFMRRPAPPPVEPETETKSSEATSTYRTAPTVSERGPVTESRARSDSAQVKRNAGAQSGVKRDRLISIHLANNNAPAITTRHAVKEVSLLKPVENRVAQSPALEPFDASKRHSMPATPTVAQIQSTLAAKSAANAEDRRRSWQPASPVPSTSQGPPRASSRLTANRLAWIKELEEGKHRNQGGDPMLRNLRAGGSVADKLANFEAKQIATPVGGGRLTRTNSIISRVSMMDSSYAGGTTTARTSIDTSHRASSVMSYYDDSFREKMESIAGNFAPKDGDEAADNKPTAKVTINVVPV